MKEIIKYEKAAPFTLWQINALLETPMSLDFTGEQDHCLLSPLGVKIIRNKFLAA